MSQEAYKEAMEELDQLEKSLTPDTEDEIDTLAKSLEEELAGEEELQKSKDGDADDKDGDSDPEEEDKDDDAKPEEGEFEKSEHEDFEDELVKASEAYASLEESMHKSVAGLHEEIDGLRKGMAALMNLNIKQAKVIGAMHKSRSDESSELESMKKSIAELGGQPASPNRAMLGMGGNDDAGQSLQKSVSEVTELLQKSISEGKIDARYLSIYGTYKDVEKLPSEVRTIIGL